MATSYAVTASIGNQVIARDVLYPTSCMQKPSCPAWSRNPAYGVMTMVPLKTGVLDAFRKNADNINTESDVALQISDLEAEMNSQKDALRTIEPSFRQALAGK